MDHPLHAAFCYVQGIKVLHLFVCLWESETRTETSIKLCTPVMTYLYAYSAKECITIIFFIER